MFDDLLCPVDRSDCTETALAHAKNLALHFDATVHILHVIDERVLETPATMDRLQDDAEDLLEEYAGRFEGVATTTTVRTGVPPRAVTDHAADVDADLIAMGTHGRSGTERLLLGSVTERVVRTAEVPVVAVPPGADTHRYGDVLVPTDGSDGAMAALDPAVDVAGAYGADLHALSVVNTASLGIDTASTNVVDALEEAARSTVEDVREAATTAGAERVTTAVEFGTPHAEIVSYADEEGVDLIAMGTHGRTGIERYLLGSVTEKVLRTSSVPVLTVKGGSAE